MLSILFGAFFWDYSIYSYSGITITKHTEYLFPKEQINWRDKNKGDETEDTQFSRQKNTITDYSVYSEQTAIPSVPEHNWRNTIPFIPESE